MSLPDCDRKPEDSGDSLPQAGEQRKLTPLQRIEIIDTADDLRHVARTSRPAFRTDKAIRDHLTGLARGMGAPEGEISDLLTNLGFSDPFKKPEPLIDLPGMGQKFTGVVHTILERFPSTRTS